MMKDPQIDCSIFLFINSGSGSGIGHQLSQLKGPMRFKLQVPKHYHMHLLSKKYQQIVNVHFYNMKQNKDEGLKLLNQQILKNIKCLGVICGGDGTVTWVISQLHKNSISTRDVPFAIIPLGTGNDFSQSLGWGATTQNILSDNYRKLKKFLVKMLIAEPQDLDVWQVTAQSFQYGKIQKYEDSEHKNIGLKITKPFVNYFSFGLDGKVGYSFDMHRTRSRLGNLTVYGALGFVKGITKTKNLHQLVQRFRQDRVMFQDGRVNLVHNENEQIIFSPAQQGVKSKYLYQYNENILALNINSFMGGVKDIWKKSQSSDKQKPKPQSSSDGMLEFVSFSGSLSIGMQKTLGGYAHRVHQGSGPFYFSFKSYDPNLKHRTYLQVDGEFYRFNHPKEVSIKKSELLQGKFRVLRWKKPSKPKKAGCLGCLCC